MRNFFLFLLALTSLPLAAPAVAQDPAIIISARQAGLIGERYDGYLGFVTPNPSAELRRQVNAINIRRRSLYSQLASRRGVSPQEVGITTACSLLRRLNPGEFFQLGQGGWRQLAPGQSAAPSYCV